MKKRNILCLSALLLMGCQSTIEFNYEQPKPFYVVEGFVSNEGVQVSVMQSMGVKDSVSTYIRDAIVTLRTDDMSETLELSDMCYVSPSHYKPEVGKTYQLDITLENVTYSATSYMNAPTTIDSVRLDSIDFQIPPEILELLNITEDTISGIRHTCTLYFKDTPGQEDYYFYTYTIAGRGTPYKRSYFSRVAETDNAVHGISIRVENHDTICFEMRHIDANAYQFMHEVYYSQIDRVNPNSAFGEGCLGYFSAYAVTRETIVIDY